MGPHPAVAQVRLGVRRSLTGAGLEPGDLVLAACSGGVDSLALAAALAFEAPRLGLRGGGVTVDHGLQAGSAEQAAKVVKVLAAMGLDPVQSVRVTVPRPRSVTAGGPGREDGPAAGGPACDDGPAAVSGAAAVIEPGAGGARSRGYPGPEGAARAARYLALDRAASAAGAAAILLGHTRDDQAETVLLGLARGSGARSLAGMAERSGCYLRPLLAVGRAQTRAACAAQNLEPWDDPHNADPGYARARARHRLLPALEEELGPGVTEALARSARQLRADADFLDALAEKTTERMSAGGSSPLALDAVAALPQAIRSRVLRNAAIGAGCPPGALTARHIAALDALATEWRGQRWTDLPGGIRGQRRYGKLLFSASHRGGDPPSTPRQASHKGGEPPSTPRQASDREGARGRD